MNSLERPGTDSFIAQNFIHVTYNVRGSVAKFPRLYDDAVQRLLLFVNNDRVFIWLFRELFREGGDQLVVAFDVPLCIVVTLIVRGVGGE